MKEPILRRRNLSTRDLIRSTLGLKYVYNYVENLKLSLILHHAQVSERDGGEKTVEILSLKSVGGDYISETAFNLPTDNNDNVAYVSFFHGKKENLVFRGENSH